MSAMEELTGRLVERIRGRDNAAALEAVNALRSFDGLEVLRGETLIRASLQNVDLSEADLRETVLIWANLQNAKLMHGDLRGTVLFRADLLDADLTGARLQRAYLLKANLQGANLDSVVFDAGTTLPDGSAWQPDIDMGRFTDPDHRYFWRDDDPTSPAYHGGLSSAMRHSRLM